MSRRIFIAINLPKSVKEKLASYRLKYAELPCRWIKKENLHITLEFLGYLIDEDVVEVCQRTRKIAAKKKPFTLNLNKICYGPTDKKPIRMVWAVGERIKEFNITPHITLGRLKTWEFRRIDPEERPEISEEIKFSFEVNSIEVMESRLKKGGPEYTILESCPLKK